MNYLNHVLKHKYLTAVVLLLLVVVSGYGMTRLEFVADLKVFFGKDNPQLRDLNAFEKAFAKHGAVMFAVDPKTDSDIFTRQTLGAIKELTKAAWEIPYSSTVDSITDFSYTRSDGDELVVEDLVKDPAQLTDKDLAEIKAYALSEPQLINTMISVSGNISLVSVVITNPDESPQKNKVIADHARKLAGQIMVKYPHIDVKITGTEIVNNAFGEVSRDDMLLLYPIMFAIMVVMMFLMVPSWSGVFSTLLIVLTSAVTAMGAAGWMGITLSTASAIAPVIILTLAVSDSIHLLVSMLYYLEHGKTKEEAIQEALRINFEPVFWTSITTAVGFLSMLSCDSPPFQDLGVIVAIGVTAAFFLSITLLPALMSILPVGKVRVSQNRLRRFFDMDRLGHWVVAKRAPLLWGIVLLALILAAGFFRLELSDNFAEYLDDRYELRRVSDYLEENIPALSGIEYLMDSGEEGGVNEPDYLRKLEAFTNWCNEQPEVSQVSSLLLLIKRLNMNMHGDDPAFRVIPENRELVAQYLLLYEMSMPFGQDINATVTPDRSAMRFTVLMKRLTTSELRGFEERAAKWLAGNWGAPQPPRATGLAIMFAHISERNIKSMINSTILALLTITAMLIVAFRSFKFGMLSLIPNVMPAIMTFGLWGLLAGYINMAVSFIASMSLGIVVDDTVHFLSKYLRARRELHLSPQEAVIYSFHTVGWGMLTTSVVLSFGFSVLFFSGFAVNSVMGILMAITIVFALIADYFVLSPLLSLIDKKEK